MTLTINKTSNKELYERKTGDAIEHASALIGTITEDDSGCLRKLAEACGMGDPVKTRDMLQSALSESKNSKPDNKGSFSYTKSFTLGEHGNKLNAFTRALGDYLEKASAGLKTIKSIWQSLDLATSVVKEA